MDEYKDAIMLAEEAEHWELVVRLQPLDLQQRLAYLQDVLAELSWHPKNDRKYAPHQLEETVHLYARLVSRAASDVHVHPTLLAGKSHEDCERAKLRALQSRAHTALSELNHLPESSLTLRPESRQYRRPVYTKARAVFVKDIAEAWAGYEEAEISFPRAMFEALVKELLGYHGDEALKVIREVNGTVPISRLCQALYGLREVMVSSPKTSINQCFRDLTIAWVKRLEPDLVLLHATLALRMSQPFSLAGEQMLHDTAKGIDELESSARSVAEWIHSEFVVGKWKISSHDLYSKRVVLYYEADSRAVRILDAHEWAKITKGWRERINRFEHVVRPGVTVELNIRVQLPDGDDKVFSYDVKSKKILVV